ncbi:MAG: acetylxylan esterase [Acidobacteriota bacterium]
MMDLLHIKSLRPGANPNDPKSPNYVNYNEAKANPYPNLPNPLVLNDGQKVTTPAMWWNERRAQIVQDFSEDVYGFAPKDIPSVKWEVKDVKKTEEGGVPVVTKHLVGHVDNSSYPLVNVNIRLTLTTPAQAVGPVPVIIEFGLDPEVMRKILAMLAKRGVKLPPPPKVTWSEQLLHKGWGYAVYYPTDVQADNGAGLTEGIIGLCNKGQPRKPDQWGALRAWAWGASRVLDYFETDSAVNAKEVGVMGHSRYGKAALVAMAYDQRFAIGYISSSGKGGAALYRRNFGERNGNVAGVSEFHWMAGNYLKYAGPLTANDLPVDSHELVALCAPRPVFIGCGTVKHGDGWVDPRGMFMAAVAAGPVYRLLGEKGLESSTRRHRLPAATRRAHASSQLALFHQICQQILQVALAGYIENGRSGSPV